MISSNDTTFGLGTTAIAVPPGGTLAVYITPQAGQNSLLLKNGLGGTLVLIGMASGVTLSLTDLAAASTSHYLVGVSEVLSFDGPVTCYLANIGTATHLVYPIRGRTSGF